MARLGNAKAWMLATNRTYMDRWDGQDVTVWPAHERYLSLVTAGG
jgi:hypothetical protein